MSDIPKPTAADAYENMEALLCEMQGLRDQLVEVKRERDEARGALEAQDKRMEIAGKQCGVPFVVFGCDWPDRVAEELNAVADERNAERKSKLEIQQERDALRDAINALHDYVQGKRHDNKDISEIVNGAMKI